jgi:plastocyanin
VTGLLALVVMITAACQADRAADATPVSGVTEVVAKRLRFRPSAIQVVVGTDVTWRFEDDAILHNVTGDGFASKNQANGAPGPTGSTGRASVRASGRINQGGGTYSQTGTRGRPSSSRAAWTSSWISAVLARVYASPRPSSRLSRRFSSA